ncbi:MAG: acyltransferase [Muribaculaceae bacterium]|nr:acyltransferase [Muribaculaceae bacterium]
MSIDIINDRKSQVSHHSHIIDIIRALSAIFIVLYHYTYRYNENKFIIDAHAEISWPFQVSWGYGAVSTFFILSGYLLAKNVENVKAQAGHIFIKRMTRLYPTYWVCMSITTLVLLTIFPEAKVSLKEYLINLSMLASNFKTRFVDGAYWTMAYEVKFAVIVFLLLLIPKISTRKITIGLILIFSILEVFYGNLLLFKILRVCLIIDWIQVFVSGIAIHYIQKKKSDIGYWVILFLCLCAQFYRHSSSASPSNIFFIATLLLLYLRPKLDLINIPDIIYRLFEFIALISYPLYLLHQMIGFAIIKWLRSVGQTSELWIILPVGVSIILALIIHKFIEVPTSKGSFINWPRLQSKQ